jgi:integrase
LHPDSADKILRKAFSRADIEGASTHSFRRTARSRAMSNAGIGLRIIQEISGHNNLEQLQHYERGEAGSSQRSDRESFHAFLQRDSSFS